MRVLFREGEGPRQGGGAGATTAREKALRTRAGRARRIVCVRCGAHVANAGETVSAGGSSRHERVNPAAIVYRFTLYRRARGAVAVGPSVTDFTWFDGYAWRVAECRKCALHLGWRFEAVEGERVPPNFFGLLNDRVREAEHDEGAPPPT